MSRTDVQTWIYLIKNFMPRLPTPHGNLRFEGFLAYARKLSDRNKNMLRRMLACLDMNGVIRQNNQLTYALWTDRDRKANRIRSKNRRLFIQMGLVKVGDGKHVHHKDGNVFNNKRSNLSVVDGKKHKKSHASNNHVANQTCKAFMAQWRRLTRTAGSRTSSARAAKRS